jgi:membrane-associated phospholipid phosphatase
MGLFSLALVATTLTFANDWPWLGLYLLLNILTPLSFLVWQLRRGSITDLDIQLREQRRNTLLVTIGGFAFTWLVMLFGGAPPALTLLAGAGMLQWIIIFAITMRWKVSIHSTSATGVAILILRIFGLSAVPLVISIPLIAWSRVKLRHHTPAQTIVGVILGAIVPGWPCFSARPSK